MMKLTTMWKVVDTVDEQKHCPLAETILQRWDHDANTVRFFRASANFVCVFTKDRRRHFLRFNESTERTRVSIEAEVHLLTWLDAQGIKVAQPVRSINGQWVETVDTDLGTYHAVVFVGLDGAHPDMEEFHEAEFCAWGASLGKLHAAMKLYQDPSMVDRNTWRDHLALAQQFIADDQHALLEELRCVTTWANTLPTDSTDFGLIHFDYETDNLCWQDGRIAALDFDDCAHYWFVADIAFALRDLFTDGVDLDKPMFQEFLAGYEECCPVNPELLSQLPMFMRLHKLYFYGRITRALDLPADCEAPPWLQKLNAKLQHRLEVYEESLQ